MNSLVPSATFIAPALLVSAFDQSPNAALLIRPDDELTLLWRNRAHEVMTATEGLDVSGLPMFEAFPPGDDEAGAETAKAIRACVARILETGRGETMGPHRFDLLDRSDRYVEYHWRMTFEPIRENDAIVAILQTATDVTAEVLGRRLAEGQRRAAVSTAAACFFSYDPETDLFDRHPGIDEMFGFAPDAAGRHAAPFFARVHPEDLPGVDAEVQRVMAAPLGDIASFDYRVVRDDGGERFLRIRGEVVTDPVDRRPRLVGTFVDLTDIETNRRDLSRALEIREALVQEAHHRINNSLQIAMSVLRIERKALAAQDELSPEMVDGALLKAEARIRAVAEIHGLMRMDETSHAVPVLDILRRLVGLTRQSTDLGAEAVRFDAPEHGPGIASERAICLGLILNELLTNAVKYGRSADGRADIVVAAEVGPEGVAIRVENGMAEGTGGMPSTGRGGFLADQFAAQIGVEIAREACGGRFRAAFVLPPDP